MSLARGEKLTPGFRRGLLQCGGMTTPTLYMKTWIDDWLDALLLATAIASLFVLVALLG